MDEGATAMTTKREAVEETTLTPDGGVALIASILETLEEHADAYPRLVHTVVVLRDVVSDWQAVYHSLENQLVLALTANEAMIAQVAGLRRDLEAVQQRYYRAEQRVLDGKVTDREE